MSNINQGKHISGQDSRGLERAGGLKIAGSKQRGTRDSGVKIVGDSRYQYRDSRGTRDSNVEIVGRLEIAGGLDITGFEIAVFEIAGGLEKAGFEMAGGLDIAG